MELYLPIDVLNEIYLHTNYITRCVLKFVNKMYYNKSFKINIRKLINMMNNNLIPNKNGLPSFCWKRLMITYFNTEYINGQFKNTTNVGHDYSYCYNYLRALRTHKLSKLCSEAQEFYHTKLKSHRYEEGDFDYKKLLDNIKFENDNCCEFYTAYRTVDFMDIDGYYNRLYYDISKNYSMTSLDLELAYTKNEYTLYSEDYIGYLGYNNNWCHNEFKEDGDLIFKDKCYDKVRYKMKRLFGQYSFHRNGSILYDRTNETYIRLEPVFEQFFHDCINAITIQNVNISSCKIRHLFNVGFYNNQVYLSSEHTRVLFNNYPVNKYGYDKYHEWSTIKTFIGKIYDGNIILYEISLNNYYYGNIGLKCEYKPKKNTIRQLDALLIYPIKGLDLNQKHKMLF